MEVLALCHAISLHLLLRLLWVKPQLLLQLLHLYMTEVTQ